MEIISKIAQLYNLYVLVDGLIEKEVHHGKYGSR